MKQLIWCVLATASLFASTPGVDATPDFQVSQLKGTDRIAVAVRKAGDYRLEIDDAPGFRTPVWTRDIRGKKLEFEASEAGMTPGTDYYVRLNGTGPLKRLRLSDVAASGVNATCEIQRASWETIGRQMIERRSAVQWQEGTDRWVVSSGQQPTGLSLYFTELYLRSALESAHFCDDMRLYDEISQYYLLMLQQTVPLGVAELQKQVLKTGMMAERTFRAGANLIGDNELGNAQWLYPAAKLVRLISLLPAGQRSSTMRQFASEYTAFIVDEQLLRFLMRPARPAPGGGRDVSRVGVWELTLKGVKGKRPWDTAMSDTDLWLLSCSAEMLGAHANDPALVQLDEHQVAQLRSALQTGIRLFQSKLTLYPDTTDFQGRRVGSASYFNGDYDSHEEYAFSAVTEANFPSEDQKRAAPNVSWDISHAYRIPVFLRALYESKKATASEFPKIEDMKLLTDQYVYRVFNGDFSRPLFRNFLDGSDTWFRVDLGKNFGYPPSQFCDMRRSNRLCMAPGDVAGWGLLAFVNPDLAKLEEALVRLAFQTGTDAQQFRDRHYLYWESFGLISANGKRVYGDTLFFLIADNAAMMAGSRPSRPFSEEQSASKW